MSYQSMLRDVIAVVAIFVIVGLALGATGYMSISGTITLYGGEGGQFGETLGELFVALVFVESLVIALFLGPAVAGITGVLVGLWEQSLPEALAVGALGSVLGFYPMIALAVYIMAAAIEGTGVGQVPTQTDPVLSVIQVIALAIPTVVVGVLSSGIVYWRSYSFA